MKKDKPEGIRQTISGILAEKKPEKISEWWSEQSARIRTKRALYELNERNKRVNKQFDELDRKLDELAELRIREIRAGYARRICEEAARQYNAEGGIRFYGQQFLLYTAHLMEREDDVRMLVIGAYNSGLKPMRTRYEVFCRERSRLEQERNKRVQKITEAAQSGKVDKKLLKKQLGFRLFGKAAKALKQSVEDKASPELIAYQLANLEHIVTDNEKAILRLKKLLTTSTFPEPDSSLMRNLDELLGDCETLDRLASPGGRSAAEYRKDISDYGDKLTKAFPDMQEG